MTISILANLEPPVDTIAIVVSLKSLVAEVMSEASKLNRLNPGDYISAWELQRDVEDIYTLLDESLKELEAAAYRVVTANEHLSPNSAKKPGSTIDVSEAGEGVSNDSAQQTSDQAATAENEGQSDPSQLDVSSEPYPPSIISTNTASPPASPPASPEPRLQSNANKVTSNEAKVAVHKRRVKTRASARLKKMAHPEPRLSRYEKHIDDRDDIPTLELKQLGENLAATIDTLASDADNIQKAQVPGLAEAMKRRPTNTWNLEPKDDRDGRDVNRNIVRIESEDFIKLSITNNKQSFHRPGFEGLKYRMTNGEVGPKLACFVNDPERCVPHYAGVMKSPLWDLCPLHEGRLAEIDEPYAHCGIRIRGLRCIKGMPILDQ